MIKVGFIGTGNMGGALAVAASRSSDAKLYLADFFRESAERLAEKTGGEATDNCGAAENSDILFLGVKPDNLEDVADSIRETLKSRNDEFLIVSMLAGKTLEQLENAIGFSCPIIRILPNVPVMVGEGLIMYHPNDRVTDLQLEKFFETMKHAGRFSLQQEKLFPAGAGIAGCGPAFAAIFVEALADGGVACGLSRAQAIEYAAQMAKGTAEYILAKGIHPDALKDTVTSPGGTTIQGVRLLEKRAFRSALTDAVIATYEKDVQIK